MARSIKKEHKEDIVLTLDWSQASHNDKGLAACGNQNCPVGVWRAATWIGPVADQVALHLKQNGITNSNNLNLVGHSLGSILSGEISQRMGTVPTVIALDPPSEMSLFNGYGKGGPNGEYAVYETLPQGLPQRDKHRKRFTEYANFTRSFVGARSLAGNHPFAKTAHESVVVDFNNFIDMGKEHGLVVDVWNNLIDNRKFYAQLLDTHSMHTYPNFKKLNDNHNFRIFAQEEDNQYIYFQEDVKLENNQEFTMHTLHGTTQGDRINYNHYTNKKPGNFFVSGGGGKNTFYN